MIETAFITNSMEYNLIEQDEFKSKISRAIADGNSSYSYDIEYGKNGLKQDMLSGQIWIMTVRWKS